MISIVPSFKELYSRRSDTTANVVQQGIKASTSATHPYDLVAVAYAGRMDNLTGTTITVFYEMLIEYTGYFTDRVNAYNS